MAGIMDLLGPLLQGEGLDKLSRFVGESTGGTHRAMEAASASSIGALAQHASSEQGAAAMMQVFRSGDYPQLEVSDVGGTISDPQASSEVLQKSEGALSRIFGRNLGAVVDGVATHAGVGRSGSSRLLGLAMPIVLGIIGKHALKNNLDAGGLQGYLGGQRSLTSSMLPGSLAAIFGGGARAEEHRGWRERGERRVEEWRERAGAPHRAEVAGHDGRRYLPWAVLVVAALIGISLLARRHKAEQAASRARE